MKVLFLLDENLPPRLRVAVQRLNPNINILRVGDPGTPVLGTPDPDVLHYLELSRAAVGNRQPQKYAKAFGSTLS